MDALVEYLLCPRATAAKDLGRGANIEALVIFQILIAHKVRLDLCSIGAPDSLVIAGYWD